MIGQRKILPRGITKHDREMSLDNIRYLQLLLSINQKGQFVNKLENALNINIYYKYLLKTNNQNR